jgi:hypothetical protein
VPKNCVAQSTWLDLILGATNINKAMTVGWGAKVWHLGNERTAIYMPVVTLHNRQPTTISSSLNPACRSDPQWNKLIIWNAMLMKQEF